MIAQPACSFEKRTRDEGVAALSSLFLFFTEVSQMKYCILYESVTGNTARLAQAVQQALPPQACEVFACTASTAASVPELAFIGFWTDRGTCPPTTQALLQKLHSRKIVLFGTAGFGSGEYFTGILQRVKSLIPADNHVLGGFLCPGGMPDSTRAKYLSMLEENPEDERAKGLLAAFDRAQGHPDNQDLEQAKAFAREMYDQAVGT